MFGFQQEVTLLYSYWSATPGLPDSVTTFNSLQKALTSPPMSVEALYDGESTIHVLINTAAGSLEDYPFDITTNQYRARIVLASDAHNADSIDPNSNNYLGTCGLSAMFDAAGQMHISYWTAGDHILQRSYSYNPATNTLTSVSNFLQLDSAGNASHPALAVSPLDGSTTVAWVSEATSPARILARSRSSSGAWGAIEAVSQYPVWTSYNNGKNIDQGPTLAISKAGTKYLAYVESWEPMVGTSPVIYAYGRIHVVQQSGSGWVDERLPYFTHNPSLALRDRGSLPDEVAIFGHGSHWNPGTDLECSEDPTNPPSSSVSEPEHNMCVIRRGPGGWEAPRLVKRGQPGFSDYDTSVSIKWSVLGRNRPGTVEFLLTEAGPSYFTNPQLYYGRW
jgi:hypothetical protein